MKSRSDKSLCDTRHHHWLSLPLFAHLYISQGVGDCSCDDKKKSRFHVKREVRCVTLSRDDSNICQFLSFSTHFCFSLSLFLPVLSSDCNSRVSTLVDLQSPERGDQRRTIRTSSYTGSRNPSGITCQVNGRRVCDCCLCHPFSFLFSHFRLLASESITKKISLFPIVVLIDLRQTANTRTHIYRESAVLFSVRPTL